MYKQLEMDDPEDIVPDHVSKGPALPRQPSSAHARARRKSNPATSPDPHERHANNSKPTTAEVRSDSPLLRASTGTTVERPLSGTYSPTRFGATAASKSPENKYGAAHLPQPGPQHAHAKIGDGPSPSLTHPQLPVHEPWNPNPQLGTQAQPENSSASGRPEVYPSLPNHPPAHTHVPTHTPRPSQAASGGGVVSLWGPKEEQHGTDEGIETSGDLASPVSPDGHIH